MIPFRGIALKGHFYSREVNGRLYFARWPRKQKTARTSREADNRKLIALAASITKYMSAQEQQFSREIAKATKLSARDLLMISLFGRLGVVVLRDGRKIFSMAAIQDVSAILDSLGQTPGDMFVRGETWWGVIGIGDENDVLTVGPDGEIIWRPVAASGGGLEWQQMPYLTPTVGTDQQGSNAFTARPFYCPAGVTINGVRAYIKTFTSGQTGTPGLYQANPSGLTMSAGARVADGPTVNLATGLISFPFTTPYTPSADEWLWGGVNLRGGTAVLVMNTNQQVNGQFFATSSAAIPNPAPTATDGATKGLTYWFY